MKTESMTELDTTPGADDRFLLRKRQVDYERWEEYGLGERIESPSRRYRRLQLSAKADW